MLAFFEIITSENMTNLFLSSARGGDQTAITAAQGAQGRGEL